MKTPKTKLKLNNKPVKEPSAAKPKKAAAKAKASSAEESEASKVEEKPMTEAERRDKQEKSVLYLRHRLQKGFLARDNPPKEEEMQAMAQHFNQLEEYKNLDADIIRKTKVHKVLKAIVRLSSIPREEEYNFKKRSTDLLSSWSAALAAEDATATPVVPAATNGVKQSEEKKEEEVANVTEKVGQASIEDAAPTDAAQDATTEASKDAPKAVAEEDVNMADADEKTEDAKPTESTGADAATELVSPTA